MVTIMKWIERTFSFDYPVELFPAIVERLRGTPVRLEELIKNVPYRLRTQLYGDSWSIQEHAGHLLDLEELHIGRLDDFESDADVLRPADMSNKATNLANHNLKEAKDILADFRSRRMEYVSRLESYDIDQLSKAKLHPRLNKPMRIVDNAFFSAEHDDHHLALITALKLKLMQ